MSADERTRAHRRAAELLLERGARPEQAATYLVRTIPGGRSVRRRDASPRGRAVARAGCSGGRGRLPAPRPRRTARAGGRGDRPRRARPGRDDIDARAAAEHLRQALDGLDDPARRPETCLRTRTRSICRTQRSESAELLQRTSDASARTTPSSTTASTAISSSPASSTREQYPIAARRFVRTASRGGRGDGADARHGLDRGSAARRVASAARFRRGIGERRARSEDRMYLASALAALAMAGVVDEAVPDSRRHRRRTAVRRSSRVAAPVVEGPGATRAVSSCARRKICLLEPTPFWQVSTQLRIAPVSSPRSCSSAASSTKPRSLPPASPLDDLPVGHRIHFLYARGRVRLEPRDPEKALADFLEAGGVAESVEIHNPAFVPWRSQAALALHQLGRDRGGT